jgi:hypothetical protein
MIIKSNTVLSDNEIWRIKTILQESTDPKTAMGIIFPGMKICIKDDALYLGSPPWDLSQEIEV